MDSFVKGYYEVEINGNVVNRTDNMLLTGAVDMNILHGSMTPSRMWLGSGSTPVTFSDTHLASPIDVQGTLTSSREESRIFDFVNDNYTFEKITFTSVFPQNASLLVGRAISEVGMSHTQGQFFMFSRALLRDSQGELTSLTLLPTDVLTVRYVLTYYYPYLNRSQLEFGGVTYNVAVIARSAVGSGILATRFSSIMDENSIPLAGARAIGPPPQLGGLAIASTWKDDQLATDLFTRFLRPRSDLAASTQGWWPVNPGERGVYATDDPARLFSPLVSVQGSPWAYVTPKRGAALAREGEATVVERRRFLFVDTTQDTGMEGRPLALIQYSTGTFMLGINRILSFYFYPPLPPKAREERLAIEFEWRVHYNQSPGS